MAEQAKELGNEAYKARNFEQALIHYHKAIELDPSDMRFLLNVAAVYKEQGELQKCVDTSLKAIKLGRENKGDSTVIAKAYSRCALAYKEMKEYEKAKQYYEESLSEHRTPETELAVYDMDVAAQEAAELASRNLIRADKMLVRGDQLIKKDDFMGALDAYEESIRLRPDDSRPYSNRAICKNKVDAFHQDVKDCNASIKLDPKNTEGYIRKGNLFKKMKDFDGAMNFYQKAIVIDEECEGAIEGYQDCMVLVDRTLEAMQKRALGDPEVLEAVNDPGMRTILDEMKHDPEAPRHYLQRAGFLTKMQKMVQAGLVNFR